MLPVLPDLEKTLGQLFDQVPEGRVTTCGQLAAALGSPFAAKWVGHYALHHDHRAGCLCHRIVRAKGFLGGYVSGNLEEKMALLESEGVIFREGIIDLDCCGFLDFQTDYPLQRLQKFQESWAEKIVLRERSAMPDRIAGVDLAYPGEKEGQAAYALVDTASGKLVWSKKIRRPVHFPYITTFLAFRELPLLLELFDEVRREGQMAEIVLVDGSGILHPRHVGVASHLGAITKTTTIGVTKKLLCGDVDIKEMQPEEIRPVVWKNQTVAVAIRPASGSRRPIFISPGYDIDLAFSETCVLQMLRGHRLPEPLYWADRLSRE